MRPQGYKPILLMIAALLTSAALAAPVRLVETAVLVLEVQPILVIDGESGALAPKRVEIEPGARADLGFELQWPAPDRSSLLRVRATGSPGPPDGDQTLGIETTLTLPDGRVSRASRHFRIRDGGTSLFEVYGQGGERLTLALTLERKVRGVELAGARIGDLVAFRLEVDAVRGERVAPLETNHLSTFIGEGVEYFFLRGRDEDTESVRLLLTPIRRDGDLMEVAIEVSGSLPGNGTRLLLSRTETLVTSRRATSSVTVTNGEPAAGYRFRITPDF